MRSCRTCKWLFSQLLRQPGLWVLAVVLAFVAPVFLLSHSVGFTASPPLHPVLARQAITEDFDTSRLMRSMADTAPVLLFRSPRAATETTIPLSPALVPHPIVRPESNGENFLRQIQFDPARGSLASFHLYILPMLAFVIGALSLPSMRKMDALRLSSPLNRNMLFLCITLRLVVLLAALAVLTGLGIAGVLAVQHGMTRDVIQFSTAYTGLLCLYMAVFAWIGLAISGLVRRGASALLLAPVALLGLWPFLNTLRSLVAGLPQTWLLENPIAPWLIALCLRSPQRSFSHAIYRVLPQAQQATALYPRPATETLVAFVAGLATIAALSLLVAWLTFPRYRQRNTQ